MTILENTPITEIALFFLKGVAYYPGFLLGTTGLVLLALFFCFVFLASGGLIWFVRRSWPQTRGNTPIPGLEAQVKIVRDKWGVPHIYAENEHDLFLAQGYCHAQDRLWQMEMQRRLAAGTLSAAVGKAAVGVDRFMRTVGMKRAAEKDWQRLDEDDRALLDAYTSGVNAYINQKKLPLQFIILRVKPDPWTPVDSLTFGKWLSFTLGGNYRLELLRAQIIASLGKEMAEQLLPLYGHDKPLIVPPRTDGYKWMQGARFTGIENVSSFAGDPTHVWGTNNWAVHGSRTKTGKPLLANDSHLGLTMPAIWYENGLHGGRFNCVGFSFTGVPAIAIGHNADLAWSFSNVNPDVEDLYIEKLNDREHPTQYEFKGNWLDLTVIKETVAIRKSPPLEFNVYLTRHGPIMNDAFGDLKDAEPLALRWTGHDGNTLFKGLLLMNKARNWAEFRHGVSFWDIPSQNFVYADTAGNIAYQMSGKVPLRAEGHDGTVPVPGWTGECEWQGYIPFAELPYVLNPPEGFIVTANNRVVSADYPYQLASDWDPGFRARRITDLLRQNMPVSIETMKEIQSDTYSLTAQALRPYLLAVPASTPFEEKALACVRDWDLLYETDRIGASIFQVWNWFLVRNVIKSKLGPKLTDYYLSGQYERHGTFQMVLMISLMADPENPFFKDQGKTREELALASFHDALSWLKKHYGARPDQWQWGKLHTLTLIEAPLGRLKIGPLKRIFNSRTIAARGDNFTVNGASFSFNTPFAINHGAAHRHIIDLGDLANSLGIHVSGQSGHLFHPHRSDFVSKFQNVEYHPLLFTPELVDTNAEATLILDPG